jgi:hypothetical protein
LDDQGAKDKILKPTRGGIPLPTHLGRSWQEVTAMKADLAGGRRHGSCLSQKPGAELSF